MTLDTEVVLSRVAVGVCLAWLFFLGYLMGQHAALVDEQERLIETRRASWERSDRLRAAGCCSDERHDAFEARGEILMGICPRCGQAFYMPGSR